MFQGGSAEGNKGREEELAKCIEFEVGNGLKTKVVLLVRYL